MLHLELPQQVLPQCIARLVSKIIDGSAFAIPAAVLNAIRRLLLPGVLGLDGLDFRCRFRTRLRDVRQVLHFQHDVFFEGVLNLRTQVQHGQLQHANCLL